MGKTLIVFSAPTVAPTELTLGLSCRIHYTTLSITLTQIISWTRAEKFEVKIDTSPLTHINGANDEFQLEIKPPQGASYTIHRQAPAAISAIMTLV